MADNSDFLLQFQEFDSAESHLGGNRDATTISIEDEAAGSHKPQKQRRSAPVTSFEEDNDPLANDDKTELLSGQKKSAPFWTFEYYQTFFDVETHQVRERILGSLLPWPGKNFVRLYIRSNPDLYGPFWICATLVFVIAICGNISDFLVYLGNPQYKYVPEFRKVTIAATAIYSYALLVPLALWGLLVWRNAKVMNMVSYSFLEIVCVYGYSLAVYIPAVVLWIIPYETVRWLSIVVALCLSGSVLVLTFWPTVRDDRPRVAIAIMTAIVALHILLAVGCKAYFFSTLEVEHTAVVAVVGNVTKSSPTTDTMP
ncbi:protein YIPF1 [Coregonus clupeaformis]|uniref:protein YIPF1 n=1 Tax=Coregonus clupeaformis TaxID=59861 RepID=UPI001BE0A9E0|nr:protein YIPF1 [Coregonus clupeaformis]XP_041698875.1 protein YIPF1 [Coregonus clupeaformis]